MPKALDPATRQAIEQGIRAGQTRNQIARDNNVSGSTVTKIAKALEAHGDLDSAPFDRTQTKQATASKLTDLAARRAELGQLLLEDAFLLRVRMWSKQKALVLANVKGGGQRVEIVERDTEAGEFRNYMTSIGIAVDKMRVLVDSDEGTAKAVSLLERLMEHVDAE